LDYLVVTNIDWLNGLDADIRDQFLTIFNEVTELRNAESYAVNQANRQAIIDAGGEVRTLTAEQRQVWVDAMKPVWSKFESDVGVENIAAAQKINMAN
ncbi:C4-dicarboxylate ABC transporter, partial [Amylibacter sp.]|nr:C4-dicarboxylate ABC transporter [Amylibacter sp.]